MTSYQLGGRAALEKLGMVPVQRPVTSLTRTPPSMQPASFMKSRPAVGVSAPTPNRQSFGAPGNADAKDVAKND